MDHAMLREHIKKFLPRQHGNIPLKLLPSLPEHLEGIPKYHEQGKLPRYEDLPDSVDLSSILFGADMETFDQGNFGTCQESAHVRYFKGLQAVLGGYYPVKGNVNGFSVAFDYDILKNIDGDPGGAGSDLAHTFQTGTQYGFVPESNDPYSSFTTDVNCPMPSQALLAEAGHKTVNVTTVMTMTDADRPTTLLAIMDCVANKKKGVVLGVLVAENFFTPTLQPDGTYVVMLPAGTVEGGHAICVVGYRKTASGVQLLFINSWGKDWPALGKNGLAYLNEGWPTYTYDPIGDGTKAYALWEAWTADDSTPAPQPQPTPPTPPPDPADKQIIVQVGNKVLQAFGKAVTMDVAPMLVDVGTGGRVMVPVRFDAEARGDTVGWDEATKTVTITPAANPELAAVQAELADTKGKLTEAEATVAQVKALLAGFPV